MFGGLTKTSSRIAIAAAFGLMLGGFALKATPAQAADLGGDCCADLEERVAELEATTVRKGNKKVSVTLSGWVVKTVNWWDDGDLSDTWVGDKDADLTSRFAITGSATIAPGWSAGYNITVTVPGSWAGDLLGANVFGIFSDQFGEDSTVLDTINTLYSYMYVKSDKYGAINWGYLSPASDNAAVLADISGTVIESNAVFFEGPSFILRAKGAAPGYQGIANQSLTWNTFLTCSLVGGIGADCYGAPENGVRYDSPTWGGFRFEASYTNVYDNFHLVLEDLNAAPEVWDVALFYTGDWNSIKLSVAYSYTHSNGNLFSNDPSADVDLHQIGASIMHKPSGLGIYGYYQNEDVDGEYFAIWLADNLLDFGLNPVFRDIADAEVWYVKPFWRKAWMPLGATVLYGEYGQYNDQFSGTIAFNGVCFFGEGLATTNIGNFCQNFTSSAVPLGAFVTGSEVQRWGLGVVQEIDSAAMHLFARWQHQEIELDFIAATFNANVAGFPVSTQRISQGFEDWDLFQVGGVIFF